MDCHPGRLDRRGVADHAGGEFRLVNNGSSDGSEELVRSSGFPRIEVERNRGVGWAIIAATE